MSYIISKFKKYMLAFYITDVIIIL